MPHSANRSPERLLKLGILAAGVLLGASLVCAALVHVRANRLDEARDRSVGRLVLWRNTLDDTLNAETGQRGYVITGKEEYLGPYREARAKVEETDSGLLREYAGTPAQTVELQRLIGLQQAKFEELGRVIMTRDSLGKAAAEAIVMNDSGSRLMDLIRANIAKGMGDEMARSKALVIASARFRRYVMTAQSVALLFALAGSTLAFQALHRREKARRIATEELLVEARYDPVTDLPNRRQFEEELDRSVSRAARSNEKRAVFFIDLDGFKKINDLLGHATGDDLLKAVGQALTNAVRKGDFVARLSGDEFAVIMDSPTCETARELAERLVSEVSRPLLPSHPSSRVSCSLGIAVFGVDAWDAKELVKLADTAMYASKRAGKARVTWIGDLIPTVPAEEPLPESLAAIAGLREIARRT